MYHEINKQLVFQWHEKESKPEISVDWLLGLTEEAKARLGYE